MLIGGIYFGEKTIWYEIAENIKAAELEMDKAFDRTKEELEGDEEPDEADMLVESLLNYKDVLEGKVLELEQENEKLHAEIERQDEEIEGLQMRDSSNVTEFKKLNCKINTIRARCREEARDLFDKGEWSLIEICRSGEKKECDCGNLKKQIEELQAEVRDLTAENVRLGARNENLKKMLDTSNEELETIKKSPTVSFIGYTQEEIVNVFTEHESQKQKIKELKEKYEDADLEREHLAKENEKLKERIKILNDRHQQDCIDLNKKQTTINELVDSYSELRRRKGLSE